MTLLYETQTLTGDVASIGIRTILELCKGNNFIDGNGT